jgi:hypothetical protein
MEADTRESLKKDNFRGKVIYKEGERGHTDLKIFTLVKEVY